MEIIDKLYLELSRVSNAKTQRELLLERKIKEIADSKSWEEQAVMAELALAEIEERLPAQFAIDWLSENP